jgi:hypothetical protein
MLGIVRGNWDRGDLGKGRGGGGHVMTCKVMMILVVLDNLCVISLLCMSIGVSDFLSLHANLQK